MGIMLAPGDTRLTKPLAILFCRDPVPPVLFICPICRGQDSHRKEGKQPSQGMTMGMGFRRAIRHNKRPERPVCGGSDRRRGPKAFRSVSEGVRVLWSGAVNQEGKKKRVRYPPPSPPPAFIPTVKTSEASNE